MFKPDRELLEGNGAEPVASPPDSLQRELQVLYCQQYLNLKKYLHALVGAGPPDPEDIAQAAFAKLLARKGLEDIDNLTAFLWRTAQNILASERRAVGVRIRREPDVVAQYSNSGADDIDPLRVLSGSRELTRVQVAVQRMSEKRRQILVMSRVDELSNAEIGRRLGLARSTVSEHLARAMMELDAALNDEDRDV